MFKSFEGKVEKIFGIEESAFAFIAVLSILIPFLWNISVEKNLAQQEKFCSSICGVNAFYITKIKGQQVCLCEQKSPGSYQTVSIPNEIIGK